MAPKKTTDDKTAPEPVKTSTEITVFVPRGEVRRDEILRAALMGAADQIPIAAIKVQPTVISASDIRTGDDGVEGRDYLVAVTWEPRPTPNRFTIPDESEQSATVDTVLASFEPLTPDAVTAATETAQTR